MKKSAGILFVCESEVLLAHSTNSPMWGTWMPPKGGINIGESTKEAAIRETREEIGIDVDPSILSESFEIIYTNKKGKSYKVVTIFLARVKSKILQENPGINKVGDLQIEEIDKIMWMGSSQIEKRSLPRYRDVILNIIL